MEFIIYFISSNSILLNQYILSPLDYLLLREGISNDSNRLCDAEQAERMEFLILNFSTSSPCNVVSVSSVVALRIV